MLGKYTLYAIMKNGTRYILKFDDYFLKVLEGFVSGRIGNDVIKLIDILTIKEIDFLHKLTSGECEYFLIKSKNSKVIRKIENNLYLNV
ncbi:hypothetical protein [Lysinibacillus endophyticus]|uniref:hypothetical protein n=1 Tax=Ureibacillus endophyticus TaxID=1978490 RepID=UPI0020A16B66|nr:hypothetical protein [Lysinibacillus endophyticus]MCP1144864.1 hypothetical protein [Lysinibacillus endophyticus]